MKRTNLRQLLLLLAWLTSPLGCCGCIYLLNILPASLLPSGVNFIVNLFEAEALVENRSAETLYITPFATTSGEPVIIKQPASIRQWDIPLRPSQTMTLTYDAADQPLSGIAVCRSNGDCRLAAAAPAGVYSLTSFEDLPPLEPGWRAAIQSQPQYSYEIIVIPLLGFLPVILFLSWYVSGRRKGKPAG